MLSDSVRVGLEWTVLTASAIQKTPAATEESLLQFSRRGSGSVLASTSGDSKAGGIVKRAQIPPLNPKRVAPVRRRLLVARANLTKSSSRMRHLAATEASA